MVIYDDGWCPESALNYIGDEDTSREPSPTKSPFPDISELEGAKDGAKDGAKEGAVTNGNGEDKSRPDSTEPEASSAEAEGGAVNG